MVDRQLGLLNGDLKPGPREQLQWLTVRLKIKSHKYMKLYVGNLSFNTTENELQDLFAAYGAVNEAAIVTDRDTGRSRGFGFVTMSGSAEGEAAIKALDGKEFEGRKLTVNEARAREERPARTGFGGDRPKRSFDRPRR